MNTFDRRVGVAGAQTAAQIDQGLRSYMLKVYNYMASGLLLTGIIALLTAGSPALMQTIYGTPLKWVVMLAPLGVVLFLSARVNHMSVTAARASFWIYAALMGLSLASIFVVFTGQSVARVFFITAAAFGALSLYGYTTQKSLSGMGSFLMMGLFGIIIASVVNIFLASSALQFGISIIGVLVFAGLTAYDTQKIKEMYFEADDDVIGAKKAIMAALTLYLDFINMFVMLMQLMGDRR